MHPYSANEFEKKFPDTFAKIKKGINLGMPETIKPVREVLQRENVYTILLHGCFMRVVDTDADTTLFIEVRTAFRKIPSGIQRAIYLVCLYDSLEGYDSARLQLEKESRIKFGDASVLPPMRFEDI